MASVSKTFNELVTFTRSTSATYVNSAGYITSTPVANYIPYSNQFENAAWTKSDAFVQQNLLTYSQDFDNAAWIVPSGTIGPVVANSTVSPDGTLTADTISATSVNATFWQTYSPTAGAVYTGSIWLKRKTGTGVVSVTADGSTFTTVDLSSGGWVRGTQSYTAAIGTKAVGIRIATSGDEVYIWGAQLVLGAVPGDYRATTTAALPCLYADYTGALRARKACEGTGVSVLHYVANVGGFTAPIAQVVTFSVKVKAGERNTVNIELNSGIVAGFNVTTGVLTGTNTYSGGVIIGTAITSLGNGWYLCSVTGNNPSLITTAAYIEVGGTTYTGNGSSGMYIADAQLAPGAVPGPYYDTGTSLTYAQRRDFSPTTLACLGLLVEEQRTNLVLQSQTFDTGWSQSAITLAANAAIAPDGTVTADLIVPNTTLIDHRVTQTVAVTASTTYTTSVYSKAAGYPYVDFVPFTTPSNTVASFTTTLVDAGGGWLRRTCTFTVPVGDTAVQVRIVVNDGAVQNFSGNGTSGVYLWGAQLEAGAFATSYIPTTTSQVTRAADAAAVNTLSPWFNAAAGTIYGEATRINSAAPAGVVIEIGDGTSNNRYMIFAGSPFPDGSYVVTTGGVVQASIGVVNGFPTNTIGKVAAAYALNDFQQATNSTLGTADTSGTLPSVTTAFIGRNSSGTQWNGWIRRITYYPQRLTNAQLQSITT